MIMTVDLKNGSNKFPEVIWVDAERRGSAVDLVFGTRIEGQGAGVRVSLTSAQWENLKFLAEGATSAAA
jgi:hypothetical protein